MRTRRLAQLALVLAVLGLVFAAVDVRHEGASILHVESHHATATPAALPAVDAGCVNGSVPCGAIFGLSGIQYVVLSAFQYEASILPFGDPVGDYDYLLGYGVQQMVRLPGGSWNHFRYGGAVCVPGSGWVARFIHLNHGHDGGDFDYLHLQYVTVGTRTADCQVYLAGAPPPVFKDTEGEDGDGRAAQVAAALFAQLPPQASNGTLHGGQIVGRSMWPTSSIYANGSPGGPADSHLCVLLSQKALGFFWNVATGKDRKPKPVFHLKLWRHYTSTHHKRAVPAYHKKKLRPAAKFWLHHQHTLGYVMHEQQWHKKGGYESMPFTKRTLRYFVKSGKFVVVKR